MQTKHTSATSPARTLRRTHAADILHPPATLHCSCARPGATHPAPRLHPRSPQSSSASTANRAPTAQHHHALHRARPPRPPPRPLRLADLRKGTRDHPPVRPHRSNSLAPIAHILPDPDLMSSTPNFLARCDDSNHHMGGMRMSASTHRRRHTDLRPPRHANVYICAAPSSPPPASPTPPTPSSPWPSALRSFSPASDEHRTRRYPSPEAEASWNRSGSHPAAARQPASATAARPSWARSAGVSLRLLEAAYDAGIRHFDVAPMYGYGEAESCLGEFRARHQRHHHHHQVRHRSAKTRRHAARCPHASSAPCSSYSRASSTASPEPPGGRRTRRKIALHRRRGPSLPRKQPRAPSAPTSSTSGSSTKPKPPTSPTTHSSTSSTKP